MTLHAIEPELDMRRAFVIDDEPAVHRFVATACTAQGFEVESFTTAKAALAALGGSHPAIIFLDVALSQSDAIDVLIGLGERHYCGVVHLMSGGRPQLVEAVQRLGGRHGVRLASPLGKPVNLADIVQAVTAMPPVAAGAPIDKIEAAKP
jgi:DNA-binding response OmpR family regulator